jgi:hypothetical protein
VRRYRVWGSLTHMSWTLTLAGLRFEDRLLELMKEMPSEPGHTEIDKDGIFFVYILCHISQPLLIILTFYTHLLGSGNVYQASLS